MMCHSNTFSHITQNFYHRVIMIRQKISYKGEKEAKPTDSYLQTAAELSANTVAIIICRSNLTVLLQLMKATVFAKRFSFLSVLSRHYALQQCADMSHSFLHFLTNFSSFHLSWFFFYIHYNVKRETHER